jgi:hypothetical protein
MNHSYAAGRSTSPAIGMRGQRRGRIADGLVKGFRPDRARCQYPPSAVSSNNNTNFYEYRTKAVAGELKESVSITFCSAI